MEWLSATELAAGIRDARFTSLQCVEFFIERITRLDGRFNLVVVRLFDQARARAREADAATAGGKPWGVLHGVPCTIKESFSLAGEPTTCGMARLKDYRPTNNAAVVPPALYFC